MSYGWWAVWRKGARETHAVNNPGALGRGVAAVVPTSRPPPIGAAHRVSSVTMAKAKAGKRKQAEEAAAPPAESQPAAEQREVRRRVAAEKEALGPIHHASHGQVGLPSQDVPSPPLLAPPPCCCLQHDV